jgi:acyl-CoA thioesterase FadM
VEHKCRLTVRSYECDGYGHVNIPHYLRYTEPARHAYRSDSGVGARGKLARLPAAFDREGLSP